MKCDDFRVEVQDDRLLPVAMASEGVGISPKEMTPGLLVVILGAQERREDWVEFLSPGANHPQTKTWLEEVLF